MNLTIIGAGSIGLVTGACLAKLGHVVTCVETDKLKLNLLQSGVSHIFEPGLDQLMTEMMCSGRLSFKAHAKDAVSDAHAVFITVGTPERTSDGSADVSYVMATAGEIAPEMNKGVLVVLKSTVPVGVARKLAKAIRTLRPSLEFNIASNPEFLREGTAIDDFMNPDRIVVGAENAEASAILADIYAPLIAKGHILIKTGFESAELIKYASNVMLASRVAFVNEMATLSEKLGADIAEVALGIGLDNRIGPQFLVPGPGYGGSCFTKDTKALSAMAELAGVTLTLADAVVASNQLTMLRMIDKIKQLAGVSMNNWTVAVLGVTFKAETDDLRGAPALTILPALLAAGVRLRISDPKGRRNGAAVFPQATWYENPMDAVSGADMAIILTEWNHFRSLDLNKVARALRRPLLADLRNIYSPKALQSAGFRFCQIGRLADGNQVY